jgi:hypothetical protein
VKTLLRLADDWQELLARVVFRDVVTYVVVFRDVVTYVALNLTALQKISRSNRATPV